MGALCEEGAGPTLPEELAPSGLTDLRGHPGPPLTLRYPATAVVVVGGVPGSGKSTLLRRWDVARTAVVDPRTTRLACEAAMPDWLPYPAYRPAARLLHLLRTRAAFARPGPLLVHDCGSRRWMRRALAHWARRHGRELHVVLLAVSASEALAGQHARARTTAPRTFHLHLRGTTRLLTALAQHGPTAFPAARSVVLADATTRERLTAVRFTPA
ncbi:AAA family ATPase [Streptomyces sp. TLI_171]|uniref:AAA family ATPase n=1 Tax=Streptomyces sp. TLI_171 TaxID=1938859 RepID=UPI000C6B0E00|nr:AAA family ATPase [Streptomyces sp. TLI_171]RKE17439.1 putative kinase [Streptomyces sp. TLI_171]